MSFWDFGGFTSLVSGDPDYGSDFGVDQTFKTMENQFAQMLTNFMGAFQSQSNDIWSQVKNNILKSIGTYRNNYVMSLTGKAEQMQGKINEIQQQVAEGKGELESVGIAGGVGVGLGALGGILSGIASSAQVYAEAAADKAAYVRTEVANWMMRNEELFGGTLEGMYRTIAAKEDFFGRMFNEFEQPGWLTAEYASAALLETGLFSGLGIAIASAAAIYGAIELNIGELAVENINWQQIMEDNRDQIDNLESEAEQHLVEGQSQEESAREKMQSDFMKSISTTLMNGGNLQETLINEINKWLQSSPGNFGGSSDDSGVVADLVGLVGGFGGFF